MKKLTLFKMMLLAGMMIAGSGAWGQYSGTGTFSKITSLAELSDGYYVVVNSGDAFAMNNTHNGTYLAHSAVTISSGEIINPSTSIVWKIETNGNGKTIFNEAISRFVSYKGSSNNVQIVDAANEDNQKWNISYASNVFTFKNVAINDRILQFNANSGQERFACYKTNQQKLLLYKMEAPIGTPSPTLTASLSATVDAPFNITFTDDATWRAAITEITVDGTTLDASAYAISEGNIQFTPSASTLLQAAGTKSIVIKASGYADATVSQTIGAGAATELAITTQPTAPTVNGGALASQPVVAIHDQYGNTTSSTADIIATVGNGTWVLEGTTTKAAVNGVATFSGLTASSAAGVSGATIKFNSTGLTEISSNTFDIPVPVPALKVTPTSLSKFSYFAGEGPSIEQSFKVSGLNLTNDITITAPANYEISTGSDAAFTPTTPITLSQNNGTVNETTIYVRLKAGLATGTYNENLSIQSGAESKTVTVSGLVKTRSVVISQIYGGGGNSGATYKNDFIELYNPTDATIDLTGWSVQYASATGNFNNLTSLTGTIKAGHYFLIQQAAGIGGTEDLPTPDIIGEIPMGGTNLKVALANDEESITGLDDVNVIDFVGTGTANAYEGDRSAPAGSNTTAVIRINNGKTDTDDNSADFTTGTPSPRNSKYYIAKSTDSFRSSHSGNWSANTSWEASYDNGDSWYPVANVISPTSAATGISIQSGHTITVAEDLTVGELYIQPNGKLTVNDEITLTTSTIKLLSDATNGTATILGNVTGNVVVHQALSADRWWYVTSPFDNAHTSALGGTTVSYYNALSSPSKYETETTSLTPGVGYVVKPTTAVDATFTGTLSNEDKSIPIYYNGNKSDAFRGYNLIGNPYPSALDWKKVWVSWEVNQGSVMSTMWYPSVDGTNYATYNAEGSGVGSPATTTEFIPPMQGFWVLSSESPTSSTPIIYKMLFLKDNMRAHGPATGANPLRAPKASENQLMRLQLSDGSHTDETVLYFNSNAENGYDNYDSRKMMGTGVPQIYTMLNGMPIVINGMNTIPYNTEIALTFKATQAGSYTLHMNEFSNFSTDTRVVLKDKLNNTETDLSAGDYTFTSDATTTAIRFAVVFPKSDMPTSLGSNNAETLQISVIGKGKVQLSGITPGSKAEIFNTTGQRIATQTLNNNATVLEHNFTEGVYILKVNNNGKELTGKVTVK